jgi:hypothetical protein
VCRGLHSYGTLHSSYHPTLLHDLSPYDRATVQLWARSYVDLSRHPDSSHLMDAAVHAVLAGLRQYEQPALLFAAYEAEALADLALIRSLVVGERPDELLWTVRDAAFHLRWSELAGAG